MSVAVRWIYNWIFAYGANLNKVTIRIKIIKWPLDSYCLMNLQLNLHLWCQFKSLLSDVYMQDEFKTEFVLIVQIS